jgi:hypothetical protein
MNQDFVNMAAAVTLNDIVTEYISEFGMIPKNKKEDDKLTESEKEANFLIKASWLDDLTYDTILAACNKTIEVMKNIEYDLISGDLYEHKERRRKVEQILSIMHIGRAYPESAVKRLKGLRPKITINKVA